MELILFALMVVVIYTSFAKEDPFLRFGKRAKKEQIDIIRTEHFIKEHKDDE